MVQHAQYSIEAGPSREELFDGLRLRHEGREVTFTVKAVHPESEMEWTGKLEVRINSIAIESGDGINWLLCILLSQQPYAPQRFNGFYNTTERSGWLKPIMN